ncbi:MAG: class I SAM-dependent methyltransferase [Pseudomonadota bacterium]
MTAFRLPDYLDARVEPPPAVAALGLKPLPEGVENRRHGRDGIALVCDGRGLHLELRDGSRVIKLAVDFADLRHRAKINQARSEMLVRACGVPNDGSPWRIVDATAGLGRDGYLLAVCGATVTLVERHPVLQLLLADALSALALANPETHARIVLQAGESTAFLQACAGRPPGERPDVVYCDPMFPPATKSAAVGGDMQVLHELIGMTPDAGELLAAALRAATRRVVVKRPLRAEALAATGLEHIRPSYALEGRASRFDVYLVPTLPL